MLGIYPGFAKRKVNIPAIPRPHRGRGYKLLVYKSHVAPGQCAGPRLCHRSVFFIYRYLRDDEKAVVSFRFLQLSAIALKKSRQKFDLTQASICISYIFLVSMHKSDVTPSKVKEKRTMGRMTSLVGIGHQV